MKDNKQIGLHIITYLLESEGKEIDDPVLLSWLAENESHPQLFNQYKKIWENSRYYIRTDAFDVEEAWSRVDAINQHKIRKQHQLSRLYYGLSGVAASVLFFVALTFSGIFNKESDSPLTISAAYGSRSEVTLPDGSGVRLNSGSTLSYIYNSKKNIREISFQGEGFFDVAKSKEPFVITTSGGLEVRVLGTSFNLKAYAEDPDIKASLVEGKIELSSTASQLILHPGEMAVYNKEKNELLQLDGESAHSYGWLEYKLYMNNMSLLEVCKYLERQYDVTITIQRELGETIHYNGVLQEESIMDVLAALARLSNIRYYVKGRNITITSK